MEIKMQLKHLVIVGIVVLYTFGTIFIQLTNELYNPTLNVAFIYNKTSLFEENEASSIWSTLEEIQQYYNSQTGIKDFDTMQLENANITPEMSSRLSEYATKNEMIVLLGDSYNSVIWDIVKNNPNTKFIMINSEFKNNANNLHKIDIDFNDKISNVTRKISQVTGTKKVLYVDTKSETRDLFSSFVNKMNALDPKIEVIRYQVDNIDNKVDIKNKLTEYYKDGIDFVYVENQELNKIVIETTKGVQEEINDNLLAIKEAKKLNKEIKDNNKNLDSNDDDEKDDSTPDADTDETDKKDSENSKNKEEVEVPEQLYIQSKIQVIVNEMTGVDFGIYFVEENQEPYNVVYGYIKTNIKMALEESFKSYEKGSFASENKVLKFENDGLEYVEEIK